MKEKNILWLPLVAMLFSAMMMDISVVAQQPTTIYVDPPLISNKDLSITGFIVNIEVENVEDLLVFAFELHFAKYMSVLAVDRVIEGDWFPGSVYCSIDAFHGFVAVVGGCGRVGVSGDGTLLSIQFGVLEAGVSPLRLERVRLYNSKAESILGEIEHGYYDGPVVNLIRCKIGPRMRGPGQTQTFDVKVANEGGVPLYAYAKIDNMRLEDGKLFPLHSGQTFETLPPKEPVYLYVDGFIPYWTMWDTVGDSPWLDAIEDGNYIEGTADGALMAFWTFEDIALDPEDVIKTVTLEGYTNGPYNEDVDYDIYDQHFCWIGSLYGKGDPWWVTPRWVGASASEVCPDLLTEAGLNDFMAIAYYYDPDNYGGAGNIIDALRLKVEFMPCLLSPEETPIYLVPPGAEMNFDTAIWGPLKDWDIGEYAVTVTVYCTYYHYAWPTGLKVQTFTWRVKP